MQNKNTLISFLQAFGIVLVVLGHSRQGAPEEPLWSVWLYTFHMPLFMFISGFLLRHTQERKGNRLADIPAGQFLRKKARRLLVPYVVLGTLAFVPKVLLSRFAVHPLYLSFSDYARMWVYPAENPIVQFWFLPTLFLIFLLVVVGTRFLKEVHHPDKHLFILVALLALHLFNPLREVRLFNLGSAVHHLFYFALGYYVCRYRLAERIDRHHGAGICLTGGLSLLFVTLIPDFFGKEVLMAVNGIALSLLLGHVYIQRKWHFLHHLFGASYAIYLFSWFPQAACQQVFLGLTHAPWQVGGVLAFFTGIYIPLFIHHWMSRHKQGHLGRCLAWMTGLSA